MLELCVLICCMDEGVHRTWSFNLLTDLHDTTACTATELTIIIFH
jgi:hypothetical protein